MSQYLNPDTVARDVANAFCNRYVSSLDFGELDSTKKYEDAAVIYASAYDATYDRIVIENRIVTGDLAGPSQDPF